MDKKTCTKCKVEKPASEFYKRALGKDGLNSCCKACEAQHHKKYCRENKQKVRAYKKEWREKNKEHVQEYAKEYVAKNKDHRRAIGRKSKIKKTFGITPEQYDTLKQQLFEEQEGCCGICGRHVSQCAVSHNGEFDLDHCHKTGKIRGLLCIVCNTRLAHIENIEFVVNARAYLAKHE